MGKGNKLKGDYKTAKSVATRMSEDHKMAYDRDEISRLKEDIHDDDLKKKAITEQKAPVYAYESFAKQFSDKSPVARFQAYDQMDSKNAMDTAAMQYKDSMATRKGCQISKHSSSNFKK